MSDLRDFERDAETYIGDGALGKQPGVAAAVIGAEENVGRIVRQDERHSDLARIDEVVVDLPNRHADAGVRTVSSDQYSRLQSGAS